MTAIRVSFEEVGNPHFFRICPPWTYPSFSAVMSLHLSKWVVMRSAKIPRFEV